MRFGLVLCLLIGLCAFANAASTQHLTPLHVIVHAKQGSRLSFATPIWTAEPPPHPPIRYHDTPSYSDPSKYGGGEARSVR